MSAFDRLQKQIEYIYNVVLPDVYKEMAETKKAVRSCNTHEGAIHGTCEPGTCNCTFDGDLNDPKELQKHVTLDQLRDLLTQLLQQLNENMEAGLEHAVAEILDNNGLVTQEQMVQYVEENTTGVTETEMINYVDPKIENLDYMLTTKVSYATFNGRMDHYDLMESYYIHKLRKLHPDETIGIADAIALREAGEI